MSVFVWVPLLIGILLGDLTLVVIMLSNDVRIELIKIEESDCKSKLEVWLIAMLIFIQAFQLLNFLILDSSKDLRDTIRCLDPFPDTVQFKQINKSHKQLKEDRTSLLEVKAFKLYRDKAKRIFVLVAYLSLPIIVIVIIINVISIVITASLSNIIELMSSLWASLQTLTSHRYWCFIIVSNNYECWIVKLCSYVHVFIYLIIVQ